MDTLVNQRIDTHIIQFKNDIKEKMCSLRLLDTDGADDLKSHDEDYQADSTRDKMRELLEFVYEYPKLNFKKEDFVSPKRKPKSSAEEDLNVFCVAKRYDGVQCTRKKKKGSVYCGTHAKIEMNQQVTSDQVLSINSTQKMDVSAEDIHGIIYYIDKHNNVYHTEDILEGKENPRIIAKAVKHNDNTFSIPTLF